jgi:hypothetical protein
MVELDLFLSQIMLLKKKMFIKIAPFEGFPETWQLKLELDIY